MHSYLLYVAVTSPVIVLIAFIILAFKAWLDHRMFIRNTTFGLVLQQEALKTMFDDEDDDEDFERHVASTPGLRPIS